MRIRWSLLVLVLAFCQVTFGAPIILFDNLNQAVAGSAGTDMGLLVAQRFNTGTAGVVEALLVSLPLTEYQHWSPGGAVNSTGTAYLYTDVSNAPGILVQTLKQVSPMYQDGTNVRFLSSVFLIPSATNYWVVLGGTTFDDSIAWPYTTCLGLNNPAGCPANYGPADPMSASSLDAGATWLTFNNSPQLMDVQLTPEPSTFLLAFGALGVLLGSKRLRRG